MINLQDLRNIDKGISHPALPNWKYVTRDYIDEEGKQCTLRYFTNGNECLTPPQYKIRVMNLLTKKG